MYKQCASPRCPELLTEGKWCPTHRPKHIRLYIPEEKEQQKHYLSNGHKRWREAILHRDPLCQSCLRKGILTPATVAHHKDNNWKNIDLNNGEGVCASCHTPNFHQDLIEPDEKNMPKSRML